MKATTFLYPRETLRRVELVGTALIGRDQASRSLQSYLSLSKSLDTRYGLTQATKLLKDYYNVLKFRSLGCETQHPRVWGKLAYKGYPKVICKVLKPYDDQSDIQVRWALTLFSLCEERIERNVKADLATLTAKSSERPNADFKRDFETFLRKSRFVRQLRAKSNGKDYPLQDFLTLKGSPYGAPALFKAPKDAKSLLLDPSLLKKLQNIESKYLLKDGSYHSSFEYLEYISRNFNFKEGEIVRNLQTIGIPDKSGKVRTITLGNYFLQRGLKPIHNRLMDLLRSIREDGTYQQDKAAQNVKNWTLQGYQPWCFDLTSATDRFPSKFQMICISSVLGQEWGRAWGDLMVGCKSYSPDYNKFFEFEVGQPMGLYSSWAAFSLSHHLLIRFCFWKCKIAASGQYYIIGDDVCILDTKVALLYEQLILDLGVSISKSKSITPRNRMTSWYTDTYAAEIAKRYFRNGREISPVRPFMLKALSGNGWPLIREFYSQIRHRWSRVEMDLMFTSTPGDCSPLLRLVDKANRKKAHLVLLSPDPQELVPGSGAHSYEWQNTIHSYGNQPPIYWWPPGDSVTFKTCWMSVGWDKLTQLTGRLHIVTLLQAEKAADLQPADVGELTEYQPKHPFQIVFHILEEDVKAIYRHMANDYASTADVYNLGINLDLYEALLKDPKGAVRDFRSKHLKRAQSRAIFALDLWKKLLSEYEHKPIDGGYYSPEVTSEVYEDFW